MLKKILIGLVALGVLLAIIISTQPNDFRVSRSTLISAPPAAIFPHVNNLHKWEAWSPWAKMDPASKSTFEGPAAGPGAIMRWAGNYKVGEGSMLITESRPSESVQLKLDFLKPFKGTNSAEFTFKPQGQQTLVTWSMWGANTFISKAMNLVMNCDKMIGGPFEQGLAQLKSVAESAPQKGAR